MTEYFWILTHRRGCSTYPSIELLSAEDISTPSYLNKYLGSCSDAAPAIHKELVSGDWETGSHEASYMSDVFTLTRFSRSKEERNMNTAEAGHSSPVSGVAPSYRGIHVGLIVYYISTIDGYDKPKLEMGTVTDIIITALDTSRSYCIINYHIKCPINFVAKTLNEGEDLLKREIEYRRLVDNLRNTLGTCEQEASEYDKDNDKY